ncbi:cbb3-type cytochrome oxidase assembly protein CcoS [Teredinibacter haidensis]|uniref:cbb3-type cytochrome oxidase assembly protein CcoS n=1 Tax=Teredinibacter haidensis TaxID=2731755 RepID=UPI000948A2A0|nr:cbb3-type cytochrome oxidase assembly protein CcoS [Teredinibacter haidensis]
MESLLILIPIAIVFVIIAIAIFFWAVKSGQYEDLDTEARRILFDSERKEKDGTDKLSQPSDKK